MTTIIPLSSGDGYRVYTKGASEIIMERCSYVFGEEAKVVNFPK
jgi:Ca2+ transporting ATPase